MFDCSDDVLAFHDEEVTLPQWERTEMKDRRNTNRKRLREGLKELKYPSPLEFKSQGSYAMKTMVQDDDRDYDIDDGVYFAKEDLVRPRGAEMTALQARHMVRDAIDDGSFTDPPEVRLNCVRVYYAAGYHVDIPVYRRVVTKDFLGQEHVHFELASSDWKRSDARDVTAWFEKENNRKSPDKVNGRQVRRLTRMNKAFARSRDSWRGRILSGFGITKLTVDQFRGDGAREDKALYYTMKAMRDQLNWSLEVAHPCTPGEKITDGPDDAKSKLFRDKLNEALDNLEPLFQADCTRKQALKCWDKVFNTTFFSDRVDVEKKSALASPSVLTSGLLKSTGEAASAHNVVRTEGGGRFA